MAQSTLTQILETNGARFLMDKAKRDVAQRRGHNLPHWSIDGGVYHVRFRLADSIPHKLLLELIEEKERLKSLFKCKNSNITAADKRRLTLLHTDKVDKTIDAGYGECWLQQEPIGELVTNALKFFDGKRYHLYAWCVMPNHVHAIVQPIQGFDLSSILHSWKSYTANKANEILGLKGRFWQRESFDHVIRNMESLVEKIDYVYRNPEKAGLSDWKWVHKADYKEG